jgi:hypothetical protein
MTISLSLSLFSGSSPSIFQVALSIRIMNEIVVKKIIVGIVDTNLYIAELCMVIFVV